MRCPKFNHPIDAGRPITAMSQKWDGAPSMGLITIFKLCLPRHRKRLIVFWGASRAVSSTPIHPQARLHLGPYKPLRYHGSHGAKPGLTRLKCYGNRVPTPWECDVKPGGPFRRPPSHRTRSPPVKFSPTTTRRFLGPKYFGLQKPPKDSNGQSRLNQRVTPAVFLPALQ
ncbi:MAG: hypothetical protein CM15mP46_3260 [Alphaproteobacteria bacterium]|nr:MAG: hypothetical protein CM15mP46_3260 [Alphaproteobacteria bacterium]